MKHDFSVSLLMVGAALAGSSAVSTKVLADHRDVVINTASELRDWCKNESEAALIGKGLAPANWTASYYDKGDVLVANGSWHIDAAFVKVECRIARGARAEYASMTLLDDATG